MKIYCKPFETKNRLHGTVEDLLTNTTDLPIEYVDNLYYDYEYQLPRLTEKLDEEGNVVYETKFIDDVETQVPLMIQATETIKIPNEQNVYDEEGNIIGVETVYAYEEKLLFDTLTEPRLKECVVEFEVTDENFLSRSIEEMLTSTYWQDGENVKFGIRRDFGKVTDKSKEVKLKFENQEIKETIDYLMMENLKAKGVI